MDLVQSTSEAVTGAIDIIKDVLRHASVAGRRLLLEQVDCYPGHSLDPILCVAPAIDPAGKKTARNDG